MIISPAKWIFAHNGITKSFTSSEIPFFPVASSVTGIVAADDCVPIAVKYAGNIFFIDLKYGFFPYIHATVYCASIHKICNTINIANKTENT